MKLVLVACGTALATSTVVARKIETDCSKSMELSVGPFKPKPSEAFKKYKNLQPDAIVCTCQLEGEIDIPMINGRAFLTGINYKAPLIN